MAELAAKNRPSGLWPVIGRNGGRCRISGTSDDGQQAATFTDRDSASAEVALDAFLEFGLDALAGNRRALINVTREVLLSDFCRELPAGQVVLEILEPALHTSAHAEAPVAGLLSALDVVFDAPMDRVIGDLNLAGPIVNALLSRSGELGQALDAVVAFVRGDWAKVRCGALTPRDFTSAYRSALPWVGEWEDALAA